MNSGLRAIGVHATGDDDEYGTIGLAKHRTTDDWLQDSAGAPAEGSRARPAQDDPAHPHGRPAAANDSDGPALLSWREG